MLFASILELQKCPKQRARYFTPSDLGAVGRDAQFHSAVPGPNSLRLLLGLLRVPNTAKGRAFGFANCGNEYPPVVRETFVEGTTGPHIIRRRDRNADVNERSTCQQDIFRRYPNNSFGRFVPN